MIGLIESYKPEKHNHQELREFLTTLLATSACTLTDKTASTPEVASC